MLRGVYLRAVMATLLTGALLAPLGTCLQRAKNSAHSCCAGAAESHLSIRTNCCTVRTPLPAVEVTPKLRAPAPLAVAREYTSFIERQSPRELKATTAIPRGSPPLDTFILRI